MKFSEIMQNALEEWPQELVINDKKDIDVAFEIEEMLCEKNIGRDDELLINNIHLSIYEIIIDCSIFLTKLKVSEIRKEYLVKILNRRIQNIIYNTPKLENSKNITCLLDYLKSEIGQHRFQK